jgi:hypothetical protein
MPDDVLEMIYSYLNIEDSVNTNIALHKKIIAGEVIEIYNIEKFKLIPKCYHKYINLVHTLEIEEESELIQYSDVYGICISFSCDIDFKIFNNLVKLTGVRSQIYPIIIDVSSLTSLTSLDFCSFQLEGISNLTNLIDLDCSYSDTKYVNNLINLTYLDCSGTPIDNIDNLTNLEFLCMDKTYITRVNHLTKLRYLWCKNTDLEDIYNLVNLTHLFCAKSKISDISTLINLTILDCVDTKIKDISKLTKLGQLSYSIGSIDIPEEIKRGLIIR